MLVHCSVGYRKYAPVLMLSERVAVRVEYRQQADCGLKVYS